MDLMNDSRCKKTNCDTNNKVEQGAKGPPSDRTKCLVPAVPPVLKNVGKLAAGVAGMSSGSATEKNIVYSKSKCKKNECLHANKSKYGADEKKISASIEYGSSQIHGQKNKIQNNESLINTHNSDDTKEERICSDSNCKYNTVKKCNASKVKFLEIKPGWPSCEKICTAMKSNTSEIECKAMIRNDCSYKQQTKILNYKTDYYTKHLSQDPKLTSNYCGSKRLKYDTLINKEDVVHSCDKHNNNNLCIKENDRYGITSNNFDSFGRPNILTNANNYSYKNTTINNKLVCQSNELCNLEAGTSGINNNKCALVSNDIDLCKPFIKNANYLNYTSTPSTDTTHNSNNIDLFKSSSGINRTNNTTLNLNNIDLFGTTNKLNEKNSTLMHENSQNTNLLSDNVVDTSQILIAENITNLNLEPKKNILKFQTEIFEVYPPKNYYYNTNYSTNANFDVSDVNRTKSAPNTFSNNIDLFGTTTMKNDGTIVLNSSTKQDQIDLFNTSINKNFNKDQSELLTERELDSSSIKSAPLLSNSDNADLFDPNRNTSKQARTSDPLRFNDFSTDKMLYYEKTKSDLPDSFVLSKFEEKIKKNPFFIKRRNIDVNNCKCAIVVKNDGSPLEEKKCMVYKSAVGMNFCSIAGNPRNKTALQPGHSLMDWIRLSHSGKDLTGVGPRAGTLSVSPKQLAEHNTENDAWIAIRGKVYNITAYFDFHPGGKEELMKGVGQDATQMFNAVHPWVNYESILQKCLVGRLTSVEIDDETLALLYNASEHTIKVPLNYRFNRKPSVIDSNGDLPNENSISPKFDWVQQMDYITTIFYTKPLSNPQVQVTAPTKDNELDIIITYNKYIYKNHVHFSNNIHWPCKVTINWDTGKVEVNFRKIISKIWDDYGTLTQSSEKVSQDYEYEKIKYIVLNNVKENYNIRLIAFQRIDGVKQTIPIGFHLKLYGKIDDQELIRYYSPVPCSFMRKYSQDYEAYQGDVCILIKRYPKGLLSPTICSSVKGDIFELSPPLGSFNIEKIALRRGYLMLAAGTGITPMLPVLKFILESTQIQCEKVCILYFNRTEDDIILRKHFDTLQETDQRVVVKYILSNPEDGWTGLTGHIDANLIKTSVDEECADTQLFPVDIFSLICGPLVFTNLAKSLLTDIGYTDENMFLFGS